MIKKHVLVLAIVWATISSSHSQSLSDQRIQQKENNTAQASQNDRRNTARDAIPTKANVIQCGSGGQYFAFIDEYIFSKPEKGKDSEYWPGYSAIKITGKSISFQLVVNKNSGETKFYELDTKKLVLFQKYPAANRAMGLDPNTVEEDKCSFILHNSKTF